MEAFLHFLVSDIKNSPQDVKPFDMSHGRKLNEDMGINIDDEIRDEDL